MFSGYLCDRYFRSPVPLVAVFDALKSLGQLDALFKEMAEKLRDDVITPLLSPRYVPPPKVCTVSCCAVGETQPRRLPACRLASLGERWRRERCAPGRESVVALLLAFLAVAHVPLKYPL